MVSWIGPHDAGHTDGQQDVAHLVCVHLFTGSISPTYPSLIPRSLEVGILLPVVAGQKKSIARIKLARSSLLDLGPPI